MKISYIKKETDGVTEEQLELELKDVRYLSITTQVIMSLADAMEFHRILGNKLGEIPA